MLTLTLYSSDQLVTIWAHAGVPPRFVNTLILAPEGGHSAFINICKIVTQFELMTKAKQLFRTRINNIQTQGLHQNALPNVGHRNSLSGDTNY